MHNPFNHPSSSSLSLLSPATQDHMHELAKTLPPPRKQNTACDACRTRKVKCNRVPGSDKCQHCMAKNYPCTNYVQQATAQKRHAGSGRRPRVISAPNPADQPPQSPYKLSPQDSISPLLPHAFGFLQSQPSFHQSLRYPPITRDTPTVQLLAYVFSPPETPDGQRGSYSEWGPEANNLEIESFRNDLALDLVEVFFQIVHPRFPLLNPTNFRSQLSIPSRNNIPLPMHQQKPLHPALIATILAWGAKFTENSLFVADRHRNPDSQSKLAKTLVQRSRELAEALKVHRIASSENVVICLLIECLQNQNSDDPSGFSRFWLTCSIRLLLDLQINHKSVMSNISDPEERGTMIFAWWMALLSDAYSSAYYRRKPMLDDDDYDIDFYTADPVSPPDLSEGQKLPSSREQLEFLGYYRANHALARIARSMSRQFWKPVTESDGIPMETLTNFIQSLWDWKNEYLVKVGVPSNMQAEWDFISAISACASDATYHIMWIILFNALDEFGIKEQRNRSQSPMSEQQRGPPEIERIKKSVLDEALHGALRIAGLTGVLASNGYLRLDPAVMMASCIQSGMLLARLGRPEASNCISGLRQYSYAYEEGAEQANDMSRILQSGDGDLNHMASVVPRMSSTPSPMNMGIGLPMHSGGEQSTFFG